MADSQAETTSTDEDFAFSSGDQQPCPDCGEMVRSGVVRCWNCGAFMDKEVEKRFLKMQESPPEVLYSDPSMAEEEEASAVATDATFSSGGDSSDEGDDGDFELNVNAGQEKPSSTFKLQMPEPSEPEATTPGTAPEMPAHDAAAEPAAKPVAEPAAAAKEDDDPLMASVMSDLKSRRQSASDGLAKLKGGVRTAGGFIIFCPYGCTIEVKDRNRGSMGKCPKCEAPIVVPVDPPKYKVAAKKQDEGDAAGGAKTFGKYEVWLEDARVHTLPPDKIKLKADAHAKDFATFDFAVSPEKFVLLPLAGKGGLFGGGAKPAETRPKAQELAAAGSDPSKWVESGEAAVFSADQIEAFRIVQPVPSDEPSVFQGIPVFGAGRVVLTLPGAGDEEPRYLSLGVTQFRKLSAMFGKHFGKAEFGKAAGVPLEDRTFKHTCHYTDTPIHALQDLTFYRADPNVELVVAGYQCEHCGLTVSEDGRKKENLGGKAGKGIAKAKCPKCDEKMGHKPLETRKELLEEAEMVSET